MDPKKQMTLAIYVFFGGILGFGALHVAGVFRGEPEKANELSPQVREEIARMRAAREKCRDAVQFTSKFPSKASFHGSILERDVRREIDGGFTVTGGVDLMNALGAMLPYRFTCGVGLDGKLRPPFTVTPG